MFWEAAGLQRLALLCVLNPINSRRFHLASRDIPVGKWRSGRVMPIVDTGTVIGQAHVIPTGEGQ